MKTGKQKNSQINHTQTSQNHTSFPTKPTTPMTLPKIITLHPMHLSLSLNQQLRRKSTPHIPQLSAQFGMKKNKNGISPLLMLLAF
jgi:hypothetical protein